MALWELMQGFIKSSTQNQEYFIHLHHTASVAPGVAFMLVTACYSAEIESI